MPEQRHAFGERRRRDQHLAEPPGAQRVVALALQALVVAALLGRPGVADRARRRHLVDPGRQRRDAVAMRAVQQALDGLRACHADVTRHLGGRRREAGAREQETRVVGIERREHRARPCVAGMRTHAMRAMRCRRLRGRDIGIESRHGRAAPESCLERNRREMRHAYRSRRCSNLNNGPRPRGVDVRAQMIPPSAGHESRLGEKKRKTAKDGSALVQLAHRVLDMLAQQVAFLGRHVAVAATLVEIGGNGGTARLVEAIELRIARRGRRQAGTRGLVRRPAPLGALGASEVRCKETGEHDRQCARNPGGSHHCSRFSGRFVPFVTRQPSTSGT